MVAKTNMPIILYRQTIEEENGDSYEEIVCTLTNDYVVEQLIISGGGNGSTYNQSTIGIQIRRISR